MLFRSWRPRTLPLRILQFCLWVFLSSVCPGDAYYRRTATAARLLPSAAPALWWTATKAHLCHQVSAPSHITHAVWTHCSTAEVRAGIFGEGEQPTAVTCNYERLAERNSQTDRWAVFHWTEINLPHTCCVSRRLQWGRARYVIYLTISDTRGTAMQCARWPGWMNLVRWRLTILGPGCGPWFVSLIWRFEF